ncbi:MAG TPA: hypothetical protein VM029_04225 [Opitutaceae bacterium]|nr:hypothetical protein [Opitutaceae bacterium]
MRITTFIGTALCAALAFWAGTRIRGSQNGDLPSPPSAASATGHVGITLRTANERLTAEVAGLQAELARQRERNAALTAEKREAPVPAAPTPKPVTLGMATWEIQQATLNNLRQIDAARKQFQKDKGQLAGSVHALVGRGGYIKAVRTVDGEDYAALSMNPAEPLTVTSPTGNTVTYDPTGMNTTRIEIPAEVARARELAARVQPAINQALASYRAAHNGKEPPNEQALIPHFATPKDGADFVEYLEARKAAGP